MSKCDIKDSAKAWNDGVEAFEKAFKLNGGKTTPALKFAMEEARAKNPGVDFESSSFTDPIVDQLKSAGLVADSYKFKGDAVKTPNTQKRIEAAVEKMKGLDQDQKKKVARDTYAKFIADGTLTMDEVKNIYADAIGIPALNDAMNAQIETLAKSLQELKKIDSEVQEQIKKMQADKTANGGSLTPEQDAHYTGIFNALGASRTAAHANAQVQQSQFSNMLKEKKFWLHQLTDYMALNLMNPVSLMKNVSGAIVDWMFRSMANTIAPIASKLMSFKTGVHSNPFGARIAGAKRSNIKAKASLAWKSGVTEFNNELPRANHLNARERFREAMNQHGWDRVKGVISAALKVHPELISKGLTVPDAIVFEMKKMSELNRIAEAKKLSGAEKEAFFLDPDDKSLEVAMDLAKRATFKQDFPAKLRFLQEWSSYDPHEATKKLVQDGKLSPLAAKLLTSVRAIVQKSAMPFIKTPINIVRVASRVLLPEYHLASAISNAHKETNEIEKQRLIADGIGGFVAGMFIRTVALELVAHGLISAGYSDEDKKTKDVVEQESGGPNRINMSALVRGLTFRDVEKQSGDKYVELSSLGAFGIAMAAYSHAFSKASKEDIELHSQYTKDLVANTPRIPFKLATSALGTSLDFTFFTGFNQLQGAILNRQGYEAQSLAVNYVANMFTGVAPSTYQKFSTQMDPNVKKQFDKDLEFHENLANALGYRFAFDSDGLRNKYYSLAEKDGVKKKAHMFFDNYLGRVLEAELDFPKLTEGKAGDPISKLYNATRDVEKDQRDQLIPAAISDEVSIPYRKGGRQRTEKVKLSPEQHDYLQERASTYRMMMATPFIMSKDFDDLDHETRAKTLQAFYQEGLKYAKQDLKKKYPDVRGQRIEGVDEHAVEKMKKKYKTRKPA